MRAANACAARSWSWSRCKNIQVWRFSLYYFFVFGAFVALALWLPRYLVGVYGLDIKTAGMLAAFYSVPASIFRAYGGHLSDKIGARSVMYWTFGVSALVCFMLSYPEHRLRDPRHPRRRSASRPVSTWCRSSCWSSCSASS